MPDREKVIKKLEECLSASCRGFRTCPYSDADWDAVREALSLLKEQEPVVPEHGFPDSKCQNCGTEFVTELRYYLGKPTAEYYKYCPGCGRTVKWDV